MSNLATLLILEKIQFSSPTLERRATPTQPNQHSALFTPDPTEDASLSRGFLRQYFSHVNTDDLCTPW